MSKSKPAFEDITLDILNSSQNVVPPATSKNHFSKSKDNGKPAIASYQVRSSV